MAGLHLITGEDEFRVSETARKLVAGCGDVEVIDSALSSSAELQLKDVERARESYATPPFLEPSKATWWKNVWFLPRGGRKSGDGGEQRLAADVKAALEGLASFMASSPLPGNQTFVITAPGVLATSVFFKTLKGAAQVATFAEAKPREREDAARAFAAEAAAEAGLKFENAEAVASFVARAGADSRTIVSEIGKMRDYLGDESKTIRAADIEAITSQAQGEDAEMWHLTDAVAARKTAVAAEAIRSGGDDASFVIMAANALERLFRQMAALKDANERGKLQEAAEAMQMVPWAAQKTARYAASWTTGEMQTARARFMALREKVVSSADKSGGALLVEVLRVCRKRPGR